MSKEMTPKESLEFIIDTFNKLAQKPQDIGLMFKFCEAHEKINQALDRLELLEKNNQEIEKLYLNENKHWCETIDSLRKENQELETDKKMLNALYQEVKDTASFYMSKCEKFEKVINILKDKFNFELDKPSPNGEYPLVYENYQSGIGRLAKLLAQQEYDLLKEMLESV